MGTVLLLCAGCGTPNPVQSDGEILSALSRVTEGESKCEFPFGGDNGRDLFFTVRSKNNASSNIYRKEDPFSTSMSQKTAGKNFYESPTFCPLTNKMAFSGRQDGALNRDIYMVDASQGNALTQVTNTLEADENHPSLNRTGDAIVFEKISYGRVKESEIWIKNLRTNETTLLGLGRQPSFSPDGQYIAFVKYTDDGLNTCLWTMRADGTGAQQLTYAKNDLVFNPRFSPDGQRIVFQCSPKRISKNFDLYVIDRNGNNLTQLTINKSYDGEPYWASDGNIYFTSDRGGKNGRFHIWRFKYGNASSTPVSSPMMQSAPVSAPSPSYHSSSYHVVSQGETVTQVAQKYGVTVRDIVKWNSLNTMTLTPGMRIKVSGQ